MFLIACLLASTTFASAASIEKKAEETTVSVAVVENKEAKPDAVDVSAAATTVIKVQDHNCLVTGQNGAIYTFTFAGDGMTQDIGTVVCAFIQVLASMGWILA